MGRCVALAFPGLVLVELIQTSGRAQDRTRAAITAVFASFCRSSHDGLVPPARDSRAEVVLLVENDPSACDLYRTALGACGFAVISARHDVDAIRRLAAAKPDVVVVNLAATRD